jgi:hypothetical protein
MPVPASSSINGGAKAWWRRLSLQYAVAENCSRQSEGPSRVSPEYMPTGAQPNFPSELTSNDVNKPRLRINREVCVMLWQARGLVSLPGGPRSGIALHNPAVEFNTDPALFSNSFGTYIR